MVLTTLLLFGVTPQVAEGQRLLDAVNRPLLREALYSNPRRLASEIGASGAVGVNQATERDPKARFFIETQRYGGDLVQAGICSSNRSTIDLGVKVIEWGLAREAGDGAFKGSGDLFHSTSLFLEGVARAGLVLEESPYKSDYKDRLASWRSKLALAEHWMTSEPVLSQGLEKNAPYTHRQWLLAATLAELNACLRPGTRSEAADQRARAAVGLQRADGLFPERGGEDVSYHAFGLLCAVRYLAVNPGALSDPLVKRSVTKGFDWLVQKVASDGSIEKGSETRTGREEARSGKLKTFDYKSMVQALSVGGFLLKDERSTEAARKVANKLGWLK